MKTAFMQPPSQKLSTPQAPPLAQPYNGQYTHGSSASLDNK
ncbi:hypothetical protein HDF08_000846 [Edaphobacter lichenicola]|uniref:Uncharacterized protein n=1 Tax=Tunturiibacter lichenicola TaxID=2051959 RepID=A0A852VD33_9BACT|nr:hypothetical protein [Edaphobacter lichenicola]